MDYHAFDFENFPHGKLPFRLTRRQFFAGMVTEVRAFSQTEEHPYYRLCDLGELPDADLAHTVPVPLPGSEVFTEEGFIWGKASEAKNPVRLFPADSPANYVLQQFDSKNSMADTGRNLAIHSEWDKQRAFAYVRGVFLWLALARLYAPKDESANRYKRTNI